MPQLRRLHFRAEGASDRDFQRWRKTVSHAPLKIPATAAAWIVLTALVVYAVDRDPLRGMNAESDALPSTLVRAVPPTGTADVPACAPTVFFLNTAYEEAMQYSVRIGAGHGRMRKFAPGERIVAVASDTGKAIVIVAPGANYRPGSDVRLELQPVDTAGAEPITLNFTIGTTGEADTAAADVFGDIPSSSRGDVAFVPKHSEPDDAGAPQITAALSTGNVFLGGALEGASSFLSLGPLGASPWYAVDRLFGAADPVRLSFRYDFISSEFDDWVGKGYDDAFLVVLSGPKGVAAELITSVNRIGVQASVPVDYPGMPERSELPPQHSGWRTALLAADVGRPACVSFVLSDVGDTVYTSVVALDEVRIE